jgi:CRISPR/Cas system-associated exonuclease Cas4 (RecB family)
VVDYKSGDLKPDSHRRQVERYARTLLKAGFRDVKGYLWYIRENELAEIPVQGVADSL